MPKTPRILAFAGSLRAGSYNKMLAKQAAGMAEQAGAEVTVLDLRDLDLPMYDGDLEESKGLPEGAKRLKKIMKEHEAFLIASPEYNSSISGALKNAIDWASRPKGDDSPLECFTGKVAGIMAASPGALGGLRGLVHLRAILGNINTLVVPEQHAIAKANDIFSDDGSITDENHRERIEKIVRRVVEVTRALKG